MSQPEKTMTLPSVIVLLIWEFAGSSINDLVEKDPLWRAYMDHCDRVVGLPGPPPSLFIWCKMRRILRGLNELPPNRWRRGGFGRPGEEWQPIREVPPRSYWQWKHRRDEMEVWIARRDGLPLPPTRHADWVTAAYIAARNPTP